MLLSKWMRSVSKWSAWVIRIAVLILLLTVSRTAILYSVDAVLARKEFPVLVSSEYPFDITRLSGAKVSLQNVVIGHEKLIEANFHPARYSTLVIDHFPRNWSGQKSLKLELYNDGDTIEMYMRIHDMEHFPEARHSDRFNSQYELQRGWNTISVSLDMVQHAPASRQMDMQKIHQIMLFFHKLPEQRHILIRQVSLENPS
jgi:hypothetical protein